MSDGKAATTRQDCSREGGRARGEVTSDCEATKGNATRRKRRRRFLSFFLF